MQRSKGYQVTNHERWGKLGKDLGDRHELPRRRQRLSAAGDDGRVQGATRQGLVFATVPDRFKHITFVKQNRTRSR